ncbi:UNVERIFIED_CONTAM: hypothetical protein Sradi_6666500 [Sesamum radiatum]|uniref:Uncharacterized protein n=1 Tax=Sesamum radiatum TaxID=300843 RepID=A0AAW2JNW3_SESRA
MCIRVVKGWVDVALEEWCQSGYLFVSYSRFDARLFNEEGVAGWRLTSIYGQSGVANRGKTWYLLRTLRDFSNQPWLCAGIFNEILLLEEKKCAPWARK